jgi:hypothetical protein
LRALLGCDAVDVTAPCRGFVGSCGDLALQPQVLAALGDGGFACTAFPADDSARDSFVAGLISFAISWPVAVVIANCFSLSTATDDAQLHGRTRWLNWPIAEAAMVCRSRAAGAPELALPRPGGARRRRRAGAPQALPGVLVVLLHLGGRHGAAVRRAAAPARPQPA